MNFTFLADRKDAIPTIASWYYNEWGYLDDVNSVEKTIKVLQQYLNRKQLPLIILATDGKEILGTVQLKYYEMDIYPEKEHWLGGVFVPAKHRGEKIAGKLVLQATKVARLHGIPKLFLQTQKKDGGLYKRLGWQPIEYINYRGKQVLIMNKQLHQ